MTKQQTSGLTGGKTVLWRYLGFALAMVGALGIARSARTQTRPLAAGSQPLVEPLALHSQNGVLDVDLFLEPGQATFAGMTFDNVWTYRVGQDGPPNYPGPTLYVNPGDTLRVHYVNQLTQSTNLHTHGLHVSPLGNSDNVLLIIPPGASNDYEIKIPKDHPEGLYWYHPHFHGFVDSQIYQGLSGFLVIGRPDGGFPQLNGATQRLLELRYDYVSHGAVNANIPVTVDQVNGASFTDLPGMLFTVNGQLNPTVDIQPGETQVWNVGNVSNNGYFYLHLRGTNGAPDQPLVLVAEDGDPFRKPVVLDPSQRLLFPPGQRYSLIVQGPPAGTYELAMEQYSDGFFIWPSSTTGVYSLGYPLATVVSSGSPVPPQPIPQRLTPPTDQFENLSKQRVNFRRNAVFSIGQDAQGNAIFLINGQQFPKNPVFQPRLNTVEEWTLLNQSVGFAFGGVQHPYHIHVNDFQLQSVFDPMNPGNSFFTPRPWYQDIINLPGGAVDANQNLTFPGQVVLRMKPLSFLGTYVYHCHRVDHEDAGMMALITIIPQMPIYATGAGPGAGVRVFNGNNNNLTAAFTPAGWQQAPVRVAVGDVNGDGVEDIVAAPGPGKPPEVRVFNGKVGFNGKLFDFLAFDPTFKGGVNVAAGDVNSDGFDDIIVAPASGAPPLVKIFSGKDGSLLGSFMAYEPTFTGGVTLAAGILEDGGRVSIVTGPGPGRPPEVKVFDVDWYDQHSLAKAAAVLCSCKKNLCACGEGKCACPVGRCGCSPKPVGNVRLAAAPLKPIFLEATVMAYDATFMGGVNVGAGPIDGQNGGFSVVITGPGPGAPPLAQTFVLSNPAMQMAHSGSKAPRAGSAGATLTLCSAVMAYPPSQMQGVTVSAVSTPTGADLVVGPGPGGPATARRFKFDVVDKTFTLVNQSSPYGPFHGGFTIAGK
jgi:FtsP/CotA-like multicopper oxidase with cupredoxin domain